MAQDPILLVGRDGRASLFSAGRYGAKPDGVTDSTAAFISAANYAVSQGVDFIVCPPGTYHCPGMTCDDMGEVYIVGDGVTFTPTTYVAAFSVRDWVERFAEGPPAGRGMISIDVDDAYFYEWESLFPVAKELAIPMNSALVTSKYTLGNAPWIKEMHRHGWEIKSHTVNHISCHTASVATLHDEFSTSKSVIQSITGQEEVAFVYPGHDRNVASDEIAKNYFSNGRGLNVPQSSHAGTPQQWLLSTQPLDTLLTDAGASEEAIFPESFLQRLATIATGNQSALMYMHFYNGDAADLQKLVGLRKLVAIARSLGIRFVRSSQLYPSSQLIRNPHANSGWTLTGANASLDTTQGYFAGQSIKFIGAAKGNFTCLPVSARFRVSKPGHFAVVKASFRYKAPTDVTIDSGYGLQWYLGGDARKFTSAGAADSFATASAAWSRYWPLSGTIIPAAADWTLVKTILLVPPQFDEAWLTLQGTNITAPNGLWIDEIRCELMDYVTSRTIVTTLNGTSQRKVFPGINSGYCGVVASPQSVHTGPIRIGLGGNVFYLYSATAGDTGSIALTFFPLSSYTALDDLDMPPF